MAEEKKNNKPVVLSWKEELRSGRGGGPRKNTDAASKGNEEARGKESAKSFAPGQTRRINKSPSCQPVERSSA